jgi:hypothetical protein
MEMTTADKKAMVGWYAPSQLAKTEVSISTILVGIQITG